MLGFVPENAVVTVFSSDKVDGFGLRVPDKVGKQYSCRQSMNTEYDKVLLPNGQEYVFLATFFFNGNMAVKGADKIQFTDDAGKLQTKEVKTVQYKRDLAGAVMGVKVVI